MNIVRLANLILAVIFGALLVYITEHGSKQFVYMPVVAGQPQNTLIEYFRNNEKNGIHKWLHYFEIYERHLSKYRNMPITIVEIGVSQGGSLQMWKEYFGPGAQIVGVDINENCRSLAEENIDILIGDQADRSFLTELRAKYPKIDIVIDDGGHTMIQQITTFEELYPHLSENGTYITEDTHTSYWPRYGGGLKKADTFMEFAKGKIDLLNAWHFLENKGEVSDFTRTTHSMHFYDSVVVLEKRPMVKPTDEFHGKRTIKE